MEWPVNCIYWKDPRALKLIRTNKLNLTGVDGCRYNVRSSSSGLLLKKPWIFANNMVSVSQTALCCSGEWHPHPHGTCLGSDAKNSELYTPQLAKWLFRCHAFEICCFFDPTHRVYHLKYMFTPSHPDYKGPLPVACATFVPPSRDRSECRVHALRASHACGSSSALGPFGSSSRVCIIPSLPWVQRSVE